jgi:hypothetical protein
MGHLKDFQQGTNGDPFNCPVNGTLGATTASTANVTTLTTSSTVTHNGGTANGVAYLNGSKVLTTGSALVFDGTNLGVGVAPTTFVSPFSAGYQVVNFGSLMTTTEPAIHLSMNAQFLSGGWKYAKATSTAASNYYQLDGAHVWRSSVAGTAGNNITFNQCLAVENAKSLALQGATSQTGTGITFPATQSASSNANTLDDYEEGTFTYTINAGGSNVVSGGGTFTGYYTKVGNLVTIQSGTIEINAKSAASGGLTITGLPFTSAQQASVPLCSLFNFSFVDYPSARILDGTTTIDLHQTTNAGIRSSLTDANLLTAISVVYFVWGTSYRV